MAFDGFCIRKLVKEYKETLVGGKIAKIVEPNRFDIVFVIKNIKDSYNLFVSANPMMAYTYLCDAKPEAPLNVYNFCMVLRKYVSNGRIVDVNQSGNERIITFDIEHMNEMGDKSIKKLIFELMGKYSNIILVDENGLVLDSIKRVNSLLSSLREVMPGKPYYFPNEIKKINPFESQSLSDDIKNLAGKYKEESKNIKLSNLLFEGFEGVSKVFAFEIIKRAGISENTFVNDLIEDDFKKLSDSFKNLMDDCDSDPFSYVYSKESKSFEYSTCRFKSLEDSNIDRKESISKLLSEFYLTKKNDNDITQKGKDLSQILNAKLSKNLHKLSEWEKELKECDNKETLKLYGELLKAYSYEIKAGKEAKVLNYYTNEEIVIPLDEKKNAIDNSIAYFNEYSKLKRREEKLNSLMEETKTETEYLEEMLLYISISESYADINEIRDELSEKGYIKKNKKKGLKTTSSYKHYLYKDNYHIYVGKNNIQNEKLSFKVALGNDWWFHAKGVPGSHVIVKSEKDNPSEEWDMPDEVFNLAGAIALINSKHKDLAKGEIDYTRKKHLKKPSEGERGMVIYHTYYSLVASSDISMYELTTIRS